MAVQRYVVTGACAPATTRTAQGGRQRQLFYKNQLLPEDTPQAEIRHLRSVNLIKPLAAPAEQAPEADPATAVDLPPGANPPGEGDRGGEGEQGGDIRPPADTSDADAEAKWAEAQGKAQALIASGSKPDGRSGQSTIAAYLVERGYDRAAVEKAEKKDLLDLVNGLSG